MIVQSWPGGVLKKRPAPARPSWPSPGVRKGTRKDRQTTQRISSCSVTNVNRPPRAPAANRSAFAARNRRPPPCRTCWSMPPRGCRCTPIERPNSASATPQVDRAMLEGLFATVTNVDFDPARIEEHLAQAAAARDKARGLYEAACAQGGQDAGEALRPRRLAAGRRPARAWSGRAKRWRSQVPGAPRQPTSPACWN